MKRYEFYLPIELFDRVKLLAQRYGKSVPKLMIYLIEVGYLEMIKLEGNAEELKKQEN